jgi:hypothetical protein
MDTTPASPLARFRLRLRHLFKLKNTNPLEEPEFDRVS